MNLARLFETQRMLDDRIIKEKGLEGQDLLPMKILALQVELGELANEWRGFKFWSENQEPRYERKCHACKGKGYFAGKKIGRFNNKNIHLSEPCLYCEKTGIEARPLSEEYADCLSFILSIGLDLGFCDTNNAELADDNKSINNVFVSLNIGAGCLLYGESDKESNYRILFSEFQLLGKLLGFTWGQIEEAYFKKNKINHTRQATGY